MTPEAKEHLDKARQCLTRARTILAAGVGEDAGRNAYLAAFHAAQALIAERTGKDAKTHQGVHAQFARLTRNEPRLGSELRQFLAQAYDNVGLNAPPRDSSRGSDGSSNEEIIKHDAICVDSKQRFNHPDARLRAPTPRARSLK